MEVYRQGDVVLERIEEIPRENFTQGESLEIKGEEGHTHLFQGFLCILILQEALDDYLQAVVVAPWEGAKVVHPQHETMEVPIGIYRVLQGQEYGNPENLD